MELREGVCPECGELLVYNGASEMVDDQIYYPVECVICGRKGKEWHKVVFTGHEMVKEVE